MLSQLRAEVKDIPMVIGGKRVKSEKQKSLHPPHDFNHLLGYYYESDASHVTMAIDAALDARPSWQALEWQDRAAIFLRAADLVSGPYRAKINAATMLGQSKTVHQAEIDAACEFADFCDLMCSLCQRFIACNLFRNMVSGTGLNTVRSKALSMRLHLSTLLP